MDKRKLLFDTEKEWSEAKITLSINGIPFRDSNETKIFLESNKNNTRLIVGLLLYALAMTGLFAKYFHINHLNSMDKNIEYDWTSHNEVLISRNKLTGEISTRHYDQNFDHNYEKIITVINGLDMSESLDVNENGITEHVDYFSTEGSFMGSQIDADEDGLYERSMYILENGDTLRLFDRN